MEITFRQIKYLLAVQRCRSLSEAARQLYISQPALSQTMKQMEEELGFQLIDRSARPLTLTPIGKMMAEDGQKLLDQREEMMNRLRRQTSSQQVTLRLGISPFYSKYYLPQLYRHLAERYPYLTLDVTEAISVQLEGMMLAGKLDLCFVPVEPKNPKLQYEEVCMEEILLAAPAGSMLERYAIPSSGLPYLDLKWTRDENYIVLSPEQKFSRMSNELLSHIGAPPRIVHQTMNWDTVHILAACGLGVGFIPEVLYGTPSTGKRPLYFRIANQKAVRSYAVAYCKHAELSSLARMTVDVFHDLVRALQASYHAGILSSPQADA